MRKKPYSIALIAALTVATGPDAAEVDTGAYLAGRQAQAANDFGSAARYFAEGLQADPGNAMLRDYAQRAYMVQGDFDRALSMAENLQTQGAGNAVSHLILRTDQITRGDWDAVLDALEAGQIVGPLVDHLSLAWAHIGQGDMSAAMAAFDSAIARDGMLVYGVTHKAYALASVGDFEGAERLFSENAPEMRYSRQSAMAHAKILSQLGRNDAALDLIGEVFGAQPDRQVAALRDTLMSGKAVAYDAVRTPAQAMGGLFHVIAGMVEEDAPQDFTLIYTRAANRLWPENTSALLMTARLLEETGQYQLANAAYRAVPADDPSFAAAEMGRADVLVAAGRQEAAIEVLDGLVRHFPDLPDVHAARGDTLRQAGEFTDAHDAYTHALALYDTDDRGRWFVHYARAITSHRTDNWPAAEADFRAALALRPDHPQVLNYLGYSLVERGEKLDEALQMIEKAAAARPENGAIVDSLGWVYFQLGRYEEAVVHLERAAALMPVDPVINDHLGDALWAVGRVIEARFQWQRALSFDPEEKDAARIRDKLAHGLDAVLAAEGAAPITVAAQEASGDDS